MRCHWIQFLFTTYLILIYSSPITHVPKEEWNRKIIRKRWIRKIERRWWWKKLFFERTNLTSFSSFLKGYCYSFNSNLCTRHLKDSCTNFLHYSSSFYLKLSSSSDYVCSHSYSHFNSHLSTSCMSEWMRWNSSHLISEKRGKLSLQKFWERFEFEFLKISFLEKLQIIMSSMLMTI